MKKSLIRIGIALFALLAIALPAFAAESNSYYDSQTGTLYISYTDQHYIGISSAFGAQTLYAGGMNAPGFVDGSRKSARFNRPYGLSVRHSNNTLYVGDSGNQAVRAINMSSNQVYTVLTLNNARAVAPVSQFGTKGVAADEYGGLFIADPINSVIWYYNMNNGRLKVLAGAIGQPGLKDGQGSAARFTSPYDVALSSDGNVLNVADYVHGCVRQVTRDGWVASICTAS
jgi:DNA-binding beta-propeller fold protein YncE